MAVLCILRDYKGNEVMVAETHLCLAHLGVSGRDAARGVLAAHSEAVVTGNGASAAAAAHGRPRRWVIQRLHIG